MVGFIFKNNQITLSPTFMPKTGVALKQGILFTLCDVLFVSAMKGTGRWKIRPFKQFTGRGNTARAFLQRSIYPPQNKENITTRRNVIIQTAKRDRRDDSHNSRRISSAA